MGILTRATLKRMWPNAPAAKLDAIVRTSPGVFTEFDISDPLIVAHLMAQISHENGAGTIVRENMNYTTPSRIMAIFGVGHHSAKVTEDEAPRLVRNPKALAERVYGLGNPKKAKELGNLNPGDGYKYRGGGDLQLTGGESYKRISNLIGVDLYDHPEQLEDPAISFRCAVAEFVKLGCVSAAVKDDVKLVTMRVNGGYNGLAEREVWLRKWKAALPQVPTPKEVEEPVVAARLTATPAPAPVPPPEEPRGGESDQPESTTKSKTLWATITGIATAIGTGMWTAFSSEPQWIVVVIVLIMLFLLFVVGRERLREIIERWTR